MHGPRAEQSVQGKYLTETGLQERVACQFSAASICVDTEKAGAPRASGVPLTSQEAAAVSGQGRLF